MKRDIKKLVARLQDERASLAAVRFAALSDLTREEQETVATGWARIPLDRRRSLLMMLDEAARNDSLLEFSALFRLALTDSDAEVRRIAVEGLWMDENPTIIRQLLTVVKEDNNEVVRACAADALGNWVLMGEFEEITFERVSEIVETLVGILTGQGEPPLVQARALESLGYSHDERIPAFIERLYSTPDAQSRRSALIAMGRHGDERWTLHVRRELNNDDPAFRREAARAAGEMADRGATARLIALVRDSDIEVRNSAIRSLGEVGGKQAESALKRLAKSEDPVVRALAREALVELKLLDDAEELVGLTLFDIEDDELPDEDFDEEIGSEDYLTAIVDAEWEEHLEIDFDLDEEEDDEELDAWMDDEDDEESDDTDYAALRAEFGFEDEVDDFTYEDDADDEDDDL